ncbi:hypothetical protein [Rhodoferax antarcticus]|uniref:hypothetical protein n=1 Tax=Rhodoferax antarcticus TaxID=81479 RepID=UPI0022245959|nr:hypothetical protein [Rhodoferax antarcticus]MCW2314254.1 hypothetical protein [Rhodoferax antarcticus]
MPYLSFRLFKLSSIAASLVLLAGLSQAHPLDFLSPEQRVFMMNKFLDSQNELTNQSGKAGAVNGSGAAPLTSEQRVKLLNWFMTGHTGEEVANVNKLQPPTTSAPATSIEAQLLNLLMNANPGEPIASTNKTVVTSPAKTEVEMATVFDKWTSLSTGVKFERFRDGFSIDGSRYLDPEGRIVSFGFDAQTGDFTYVVQSGNNQFLLKSGRAGGLNEPIEIGKVEWRGSLWSVVTTTGKKLSGQRLIPLARGFIVARENSGYRYVPGKGMHSFVAPEQFSIATHQNGNVSGTGYLLLERTPEEQFSSNNSLGALLGSVKALGSTLGIGKKEDYALLNLDTKKLVPVNVSMEDNRVQVMSMCRARNFVMAECQRMDSYESLFQPNGMRNMTHYFWRINWFDAGGRPILVSQEGGLTKVAATDLNTAKKAILFERVMGIAAFEAEQGTDGKIAVSAQMGFSKEVKNDIVSFLDSSITEPSKTEK